MLIGPFRMYFVKKRLKWHLAAHSPAPSAGGRYTTRQRPQKICVTRWEPSRPVSCILFFQQLVVACQVGAMCVCLRVCAASVSSVQKSTECILLAVQELG